MLSSDSGCEKPRHCMAASIHAIVGLSGLLAATVLSDASNVSAIRLMALKPPQPNAWRARRNSEMRTTSHSRSRKSAGHAQRHASLSYCALRALSATRQHAGLHWVGTVLQGDPYQADMGDGFHPFRRDVSWDTTAYDASIVPLFEQLSFTTGRTSWGYAFRFGLAPATAQDIALIAQAMHPHTTTRRRHPAMT